MRLAAANARTLSLYLSRPTKAAAHRFRVGHLAIVQAQTPLLKIQHRKVDQNRALLPRPRSTISFLPQGRALDRSPCVSRESYWAPFSSCRLSRRLNGACPGRRKAGHYSGCWASCLSRFATFSFKRKFSSLRLRFSASIAPAVSSSNAYFALADATRSLSSTAKPGSPTSFSMPLSGSTTLSPFFLPTGPHAS
jgi:hypothetical protein